MRQTRRSSHRHAPPGSKPLALLVGHATSDFLVNRLVLADWLREQGMDVHVVLPEGDEEEGMERLDFEVHRYPLRRKSLNPVDELRCLWGLYRMYRALRPTMVHHLGLKPSLHGGVAAYVAGVPVRVSLFSGLGYLFVEETTRVRMVRALVRRLLRWVLRGTNQCAIFQNHEDRERLLGAERGGCRSVVIAGSGVEARVWQAEERLGEKPVVLMASRLLWHKGVAEFVAAARTLRARGRHVRFVLAGRPDAGHPAAVPVEQLERWHREGVLDWVGWQADMDGLLGTSSIACLPTYYGEGVPRFLLEAAAAGRPIVTTDLPGCRAAVVHGHNGLIVPALNAKALADAIEQLVADASLRQRMGRHGRDLVTERFTTHRVLRETSEVYCALLPDLSCR